MANLLPQILFSLYPREQTLPGGKTYLHLGWQSVHETQATHAGQLGRVDAAWEKDLHTGHLVCGFTYAGGGWPFERSALCGIGRVTEQEPGQQAQSFLAAIGNGELFGTIIEFSSTAACPVV